MRSDFTRRLNAIDDQLDEFSATMRTSEDCLDQARWLAPLIAEEERQLSRLRELVVTPAGERLLDWLYGAGDDERTSAAELVRKAGEYKLADWLDRGGLTACRDAERLGIN